MGLFNIELQDPEFYSLVQEDSVITIDKYDKTIQIDGYAKLFSYQHSDIEETLLESGGVLPLYSEFGSRVFRHITMPKVKRGRRKEGSSRTDEMGLLDNLRPSSFEW